MLTRTSFFSQERKRQMPDDWFDVFDDDPSPYAGTYSEE